MKIVGKLDEGIRDLVKSLEENHLEPFYSCDGMIEHHLSESENTLVNLQACLFMLDTELGRKFIAHLINYSFITINILSNYPRSIDSNDILGITYEIVFDNYDGKNIVVLENALKMVLSNIEPPKENLEKVVSVINLLKEIDESWNIHIKFTFNNLYVVEEEKDFSTYRIDFYNDLRIEGKPTKDLFKIINENDLEDYDFAYLKGIYYIFSISFSKIFSILKSIIVEYPKLKDLPKKQKIHIPYRRSIHDVVSKEEKLEYIKKLKKE